MLELLLFLTFTVSVQGQCKFNLSMTKVAQSICCSAVSVSWNGTTITGPVLIYTEELPADDTATTIADPGPGILICRSENSARVGWYYVEGGSVRGPERNDLFQAIRTGEGVTPSRAQLLLNRQNNEPNNANLNGLWHCRLNADTEAQIDVAIFSTGQGTA